MDSITAQCTNLNCTYLVTSICLYLPLPPNVLTHPPTKQGTHLNLMADFPPPSDIGEILVHQLSFLSHLLFCQLILPVIMMMIIFVIIMIIMIIISSSSLWSWWWSALAFNGNKNLFCDFLVLNIDKGKFYDYVHRHRQKDTLLNQWQAWRR